MNVGKKCLTIPRGNQKPIDKGKKTTMVKRKRTKEQTIIYKTLHRKHKDRTCELRYSGRV